MMLKAGKIRRFRDEGFLVLEGFKRAEDCAILKRRAEAIVAERADESRSIFSTTDQESRTDAYFLSSGDKIRCFFEEEAIDSEGRFLVDKARAVNKLGHAMHELDPVFRAFSADPRLAGIVSDLGVEDPRVLQSMLIFKHPRIGGEVAFHQDATFLYTEPVSVIGFWFALDDATVENGCLWGIPGGHKGPLRTRMRRTGNGGVEMTTLDTTPLDDTAKLPLEAKTGTLIVFDGRFPHMSEANRSARPRAAYTLHVIAGTAAYPPDNWLQREDGGSFPRFEDLACT